MWEFAPSAIEHVENVLSPSGPQNETDPPMVGSPHSSNHLHPFQNSSFTVSRTGKIHISISMDFHFSLAGIAAVCFLVVFLKLPRFCESDVSILF